MNEEQKKRDYDFNFRSILAEVFSPLDMEVLDTFILNELEPSKYREKLEYFMEKIKKKDLRTQIKELIKFCKMDMPDDVIDRMDVQMLEDLKEQIKDMMKYA